MGKQGREGLSVDGGNLEMLIDGRIDDTGVPRPWMAGLIDMARWKRVAS